jgi:hypothetical protein
MRAASLLCLLALVGASARAEVDGDWEIYHSEKFGFQMRVPADARAKAKEWSDGWAGLYLKHASLELWGLARPGKHYSAEEIERYAVKLTGVPDRHWKEIDKGENVHGWRWYQSVLATRGDVALVGGYGTGPKGSYLLILKTTRSDYEAHRADYDKWYRSLRID